MKFTKRLKNLSQKVEFNLKKEVSFMGIFNLKNIKYRPDYKLKEKY